MTQLLEEAISEAKKVPSDVQDAIASRILAELKDELAWKKAFADTSDEQWGRMAQMARAEVGAGELEELDDFLK